jgi:hypothetical protein
MLAPPSDEEDKGGVQLEVHDENDRVVWRKSIHDPIVRDRAVYSPDPNEPIRRVEMPEPEGAFQVVVPDLPGGETFVLRRRPLSPGRTARRGTTAETEDAKAGTGQLARVQLGRAPDRSKDTSKP